MYTRAIRRSVVLLYLFMLAGLLLAGQARAAGQLKVMLQGLGSGSVINFSGTTINCGTTCDQTFAASPTVVLQIAAVPAGSAFVGWHGDCESAGTATSCSLDMTSDRLVRAEFRLSPDLPTLPINPTVTDINNFLTANPAALTAGHFLRALDPVYKRGWILMTRSESLQTGTARFPRVLMPSNDASTVFTFGLSEHASYPGASPKAVEMMQWDPVNKTFRFHEIVLDHINAINQAVPPTSQAPTGMVEIVPERFRGVLENEPRCTRCHTTRNVWNPNPLDRGTSVPTGSPPVLATSKPNWDSYDSWGGAMPYNRDRIYQGSLEAAAFRKLLNPWNWRTNPVAQHVMEQLELQPPGVPANDVITRVVGGARDGTPVFSFDGGTPPATEPAPAGTSPSVTSNYNFDSQDGMGMATTVQRHGANVTLHEPATPTLAEGRAVQLFDRLGGLDGSFNQLRVANEINKHRFATGGVPVDVRPVTLAILKGCLVVNQSANFIQSTAMFSLSPVDQGWFSLRHRLTPAMGSGINELIAETRARMEHMPVRKANNQKFNLDRAGDVYIKDVVDEDVDLIQEYGAGTSQGTSAAMDRIRQEVFRRPIDAGSPDSTIQLDGNYVDREFNDTNSQKIGMLRFFLEPLGVQVDKWSMSVRGRSRTYTFADILSTYLNTIETEVEASLNTPGDGFPGLTVMDCDHLVIATNQSLGPIAFEIPPTFTDVQRVLNKSCIECHGGLGYPPFTKFLPVNSIDFSEEENPASHDRLLRSFETTTQLISNNFDATNRIWTRITASGENCGDFVSVMPCGGPPLTGPDINTIQRWILGGASNTHGDPHLHTITGQDYDFQSAGEFTLLRGEEMEIQARHTPVQSAAPLNPNAYTGLSSCPSINTAAAIRVGTHRITYEPNVSGQPDPNGMQLRVDGRLIEKMGARGLNLGGGGRILPTTAPGGVQIEYPGGTDIVLTPNWWPNYQLWYLNIDVRHSRGNFGLMGAVAPPNWLPALPNNTWLGAMPAALIDRYNQIYGKFADAWRVNNGTTLFDYAPGTSTATFTLEGWPAFEPKDCKLPAGWAPKAEPQKPIQIAEARKICSAVVNKTDQENCAQDVAVTGETGFARVYTGGEKIQRNYLPVPPPLTYPKDMDSGFPDTVDFTWSPAKDRDGGTLTYLHCVWLVGEKLDYGKHCTPSPQGTYSATRSGLQKGSTYYWKVVVDDAQGGTVNSEVRRFRTR